MGGTLTTRALFAILLAALMAGCDQGSDAPSKSEYIERVESVCVDRADDVRIDLEVAQTTSENVSRAHAVQAFADTLAETVRQLREIQSPEDGGESVQDWLSELETVTESSEVGAGLIIHATPGAARMLFRRARSEFERATTSAERATELARESGLDRCAEMLAQGE